MTRKPKESKPKLDNSKFCQLHCHTVYSQRDGAIDIRSLVDTAADKHGQIAVAVSDHGTLSSGYPMYQYATLLRQQPIKPIIGCEMYVNDTRSELFEWLPKAQELKKDERVEVRKRLAKYFHILMIARTQEGYYNLIKLHNEAWKNFYHRPMTTPELLLENTTGLICSTACMSGHIPFHILKGEMDKALMLVDQYKEAFGEWFFIELMPIKSEIQKQLNHKLIEIAQSKKIPMIITNDSHYLEKGDHDLHNVLLNLDKIRKGLKTGKSPDALWEFEVDDLYLKNLDDMYESWKKHHKSDIFTESVFMSAVENVARIIDAVEAYDLESMPKIPKIYDNEWEVIKELTITGLQQKVSKGVIPKENLKEYVDRAKMELEVFKTCKVVDYMLVCHDFVKWTKDNDVLMGAGRGSAASSLVAYLLGITDVDPVRWGLFFDRFIQKSRIPKMKLDIG